MRPIARTVTRRRFSTGLALSALVPAVVPHGAVARQAAPATPAPAPPLPFYGNALLGWLQYGGAIAIVTTGSDARGYICDGRRVNTWLEGFVSGAPGLGGADLDLAAADGTRITGVIRGSWERGGWLEDGRITWPGGRTQACSAEDPESWKPLGPSPVTSSSIAGLYTVDIAADGALTGTSHGMLPLVGHTAMTLEDGSLLLAALTEPLQGPARAFAAVATPDAGGAMRWIVQADGTTVGGGVPGWGSGFVRMVSQVDLPDYRDAEAEGGVS